MQQCSVPSNSDGAARVRTRLRCSRCRYTVEHPGPVTVADLDCECGLCRVRLGAAAA